MTDYDILHKEWDSVHFEYEAPTYQLRKKIILKTIDQVFPKNIGGTCLDVGCGTGDYSFELSKRNFCVQGFDFSQYAIEKAKHKAKRLNIENMDFLKDDIFQFTTHEKFDLILISEVLEHINDDMQVLKKYSAYLKDSGYIVVSVPFNEQLWSYEDEHAGHIRRYSSKRINELFTGSNLRLIKSICYGFPLLHILWKVKTLRISRSGEKSNLIMNPPRSFPIKYFAKIIVFIDSLFINLNKGVGIIVIAKRELNPVPELR